MATIQGTAGNDILVSTGNGDQVYGYAGDDVITLTGTGSYVDAGPGNDTIYAEGFNTEIHGGDGNDVIYVTNIGGNIIDGGNGDDFLLYVPPTTSAAPNLVIDLSQGTATDGTHTDQITNIEGVRGPGNDTIIGGTGNEWLEGGAGNNTIYPGLGDDVLVGSVSLEQAFTVALPNEFISEGVDTLSYANAPAGEAVDLALNYASGGLGHDHVYMFENLIGSSYNDILVGDGGNTINGGAGNDLIISGPGSDILIGGTGEDTFYYGSVLDSYLGTSYTLPLGGTGPPAVQPDIIEDFQSGVDKIDVSAIDPTGLSFAQEDGYYAVIVTSAEGTLTIWSVNPVAAGDVILSDPGRVITSGDGGDVLAGGGGADTFVYTDAAQSPAAQPDVIANFQPGVDKIDLSAFNPSQVSIQAAYGFSLVTVDTTSGVLTVEASGDVTANDILGAADASYTIVGDNIVTGGPEADILSAIATGDFTTQDGVTFTGGGGADTFILGSHGGGTVGDRLVYLAASDSTPTAYDQVSGFATVSDYEYFYPSDIIDLSAVMPTAITIDRTGSSSVVLVATPGGPMKIAFDTPVNGADFDTGSHLGVEIVADGSIQTIVGSPNNDTFINGAGSDLFYGGGGVDTIQGPAVYLSGDELGDMSTGDTFDITDASLSSFSFTRMGDSVVLGSGQTFFVHSIWNSGGHLIVNADAGGGVDLTIGAHMLGLNDFNGDGHSDLLFANPTTGVTTIWDIAGNGYGPLSETENAYVTRVSPGWQLQGSFDVDGDGGSDLLWRNTSTGAFSVWQSNASGFNENVYVGQVDPVWTLAGFGDFNGDGTDDLLWRNTATGVITIWSAFDTLQPDDQLGPSFRQNNYVNASVDTTWHIQGIGDFNGDGKDDILWRNNAGVISIWSADTESNVTAIGFTPNTYVNGSVDTTWHVAAVADFNGDGMDDILWRNNNGEITEWQSTGTGFTENTFVANVDPSWTLVGAFDFNDDGKADLLWRNTSTGVFTIWESTGSGFNENALVNGSVNTSWTLVNHPNDIV